MLYYAAAVAEPRDVVSICLSLAYGAIEKAAMQSVAAVPKIRLSRLSLANSELNLRKISWHASMPALPSYRPG